MTPKFFDAVRVDGQWSLVHQGKQVGSIPARTLWDRLVENARPGHSTGTWLTRCPASGTSSPWCAPIPCFHPDTRIATDRGLIRIEDMVKAGNTARVITDCRVGKGDLFSERLGTRVATAVDVELKQRGAPVFKVTTEHGYTVTATAEHDFVTMSGRKRLGDLVPGDTLLLPSGEGAFGTAGSFDEGFTLGLYTSDSTGNHPTTTAYVEIWGEDLQDVDPDQTLRERQQFSRCQTFSRAVRDYSACEWVDQQEEGRKETHRRGSPLSVASIRCRSRRCSHAQVSHSRIGVVRVPRLRPRLSAGVVLRRRDTRRRWACNQTDGIVAVEPVESSSARGRAAAAHIVRSRLAAVLAPSCRGEVAA